MMMSAYSAYTIHRMLHIFESDRSARRTIFPGLELYSTLHRLSQIVMFDRPIQSDRDA